MFTSFFLPTKTGTQPQDKQALFIGRPLYGIIVGKLRVISPKNILNNYEDLGWKSQYHRKQR